MTCYAPAAMPLRQRRDIITPAAILALRQERHAAILFTAIAADATR